MPVLYLLIVLGTRGLELVVPVLAAVACGAITPEMAFGRLALCEVLRQRGIRLLTPLGSVSPAEWIKGEIAPVRMTESVLQHQRNSS
jgi:hypothetical protein